MSAVIYLYVHDLSIEKPHKETWVFLPDYK